MSTSRLLQAYVDDDISSDDLHVGLRCDPEAYTTGTLASRALWLIAESTTAEWDEEELVSELRMLLLQRRREVVVVRASDLGADVLVNSSLTSGAGIETRRVPVTLSA